MYRPATPGVPACKKQQTNVRSRPASSGFGASCVAPPALSGGASASASGYAKNNKNRFWHAGRDSALWCGGRLPVGGLQAASGGRPNRRSYGAFHLLLCSIASRRLCPRPLPPRGLRVGAAGAAFRGSRFAAPALALAAPGHFGLGTRLRGSVFSALASFGGSARCRSLSARPRKDPGLERTIKLTNKRQTTRCVYSSLPPRTFPIHAKKESLEKPKLIQVYTGASPAYIKSYTFPPLTPPPPSIKKHLTTVNTRYILL